jgi:hypothetical protein
VPEAAGEVLELKEHGRISTGARHDLGRSSSSPSVLRRSRPPMSWAMEWRCCRVGRWPEQRREAVIEAKERAAAPGGDAGQRPVRDG